MCEGTGRPCGVKYLLDLGASPGLLLAPLLRSLYALPQGRRHLLGETVALAELGCDSPDARDALHALQQPGFLSICPPKSVCATVYPAENAYYSLTGNA